MQTFPNSTVCSDAAKAIVVYNGRAVVLFSSSSSADLLSCQDEPIGLYCAFDCAARLSKAKASSAGEMMTNATTCPRLCQSLTPPRNPCPSICQLHRRWRRPRPPTRRRLGWLR